jgi:hypothetical protein
MDGLRIIVEVTPLIIHRNETAEIRITVVNTRMDPLQRMFTSGCIYGFSIFSMSGVRVGGRRGGCTMNTPTISYAPGKADQRSFTWTWNNPGIPPGRYRVSAGLGRKGLRESPEPIEIELKERGRRDRLYPG